MKFQVFSCIILLFCFPSHIAQAYSNNNFPTTLGFLNQLSGVRKGDTVKGVYELKNYLSYLGYLNYKKYSDDQRQEHENSFDDSLEIALSKYQEFYNLNITRFLDDETVAKMHQPRCGVPDLSSSHESFLFHAVSHYSFFGGNHKWNKRDLSYAFDTNVLQMAKRPLQQAMNEWASTTPFKFHYVTNMKEADIKFSFMSGDHGDGYPFGPTTGVAHTFPPPNVRVHFDMNQSWSSVPQENFFDIQNVGLHELGHALGLNHTMFFSAVMYPIVYPGKRKKLHRDDINGVKALYNF